MRETSLVSHTGVTVKRDAQRLEGRPIGALAHTLRVDMKFNCLKILALTALFLTGPVACSNESADVLGAGSVDIDFNASVVVDFNALSGDIEAKTKRGDIVYDLSRASAYDEVSSSLRCAGLDPFTSQLHISRLDAEGLESFLAFSVEIAPYPNGEWTPLAEFASLVSDQSTHTFDTSGFTIYYEGLDVIEAVAFDDRPQFEIRVSSTVPNPVMALEIELDLALALSSNANACPGPNN